MKGSSLEPLCPELRGYVKYNSAPYVPYQRDDVKLNSPNGLLQAVVSVRKQPRHSGGFGTDRRFFSGLTDMDRGGLAPLEVRFQRLDDTGRKLRKLFDDFEHRFPPEGDALWEQERGGDVSLSFDR